MEIKLSERRKILNIFLDRWPLHTVKRMTLSEYVGVGNPDTFCQWLETRTKELGGIKGMSSIKFEIYERTDKNKIPKDISYGHDGKYNWRDRQGNNREQAFNKIKGIIVKIIESAQKGDFKAIDGLQFTPMVRWKIAFLYSGEKIIPVYAKIPLKGIALCLKMKNYNGARVSELHNYILKFKPKNKDIYQFGFELFRKYGSPDKVKAINKKVTQKILNSEGKILAKLLKAHQNASPEKREAIASTFQRQAHTISKALKEYHNYTCQLCGWTGFITKSGNKYVEIHHLIPLSKKGTNRIDNLVVICPNCHKLLDFSDTTIILLNDNIKIVANKKEFTIKRNIIKNIV